MEELQNGTPAQEQPVEQNTEVNETPQYTLTEDGEIQGDFSDWGLSDTREQPEESQQQEAQGQEQEQNYYTPDEIKQIGIDKLDPKRIPPELLPWYKSMQADYTRKTQALAQERKVIESLLDNALRNPAVAQQLMNDPNFVQTAQQHPELAQKLQAVSQMAQPQNPIKVISEQAKKFVEQQLGETFDEFNPEHIAAYNLAVNQILQAQAQAQAVQLKIAQIQQQEPHFAEIDQYAEQKLAQMPFAEAQKIISALQNGDIDTVVSFWEQCRKEWYNKNLNQPQQQQTKPQPQPQPVEPSGTGVNKTTENPKELLEKFFS